MFSYIDGGVTAPKGFTAAGVHCGIRKNRSKLDLALIKGEVLCTAAAVYTQNLVKGAPILVTKENLQNGHAQAVICNSGNANTCNADGEEKARQMCEIAARAAGVKPSDVIVASTGVIGQPLPIEPIANAEQALGKALSLSGGSDAAKAIMTTDTMEKSYALECTLGGRSCRMGGIAKGSGMIHPNMATMLCFLTCDAAVEPAALDKALHLAVADTFNMVSVDGDTSTNDMVSILCSGLAGNEAITEESPSFAPFVEALTDLCRTLSRDVAKDGEGATKLLVCQVTGGASDASARAVAKSVIGSSLFKAAMFGADANWGRVLCAIGYAGVPVNINQVDVAFSSKAGEITVCQNGAGIDFSEELAARVLKEDEITVSITLRDGTSAATAYGCDLTYDYVKINGDYRT